MTAPIGPSGMRKKSGPPRRCCGRRRLGNCMQCAARVQGHRTAATANGGAGKAETGNTPAPPATPHPQTAARRAVRKVAAVVVRKGGLANREPVIAALSRRVLPFTGLWSLDGAEWPPTRALSVAAARANAQNRPHRLRRRLLIIRTIHRLPLPILIARPTTCSQIKRRRRALRCAVKSAHDAQSRAPGCHLID